MHHPSQSTNLQWIAPRAVISAMRSVRIKYWSNSASDKIARISRSWKMLSHREFPSPNGQATSASSQCMIAFRKQSRQNWCKQFRNRTPSSLSMVVRQMMQSNALEFVITPLFSSRVSNWMYNGTVDWLTLDAVDSVDFMMISESPLCTPAEAIVNCILREIFCRSMRQAKTYCFDNRRLFDCESVFVFVLFKML